MAAISAVDLFCGAGGASTALRRACQRLGLRSDLLAVNHWPVAIETHSLNHPDVRHLCESIERINPREAVPSGRLRLLIAAPECTHHSTARGGRPINDQSRATAWHVLKWAQELYVDNILIENVAEFREWGPLGADGRPLKSRKGETYRAFLAALRSLDYKVEDRVLTAADYGDPTTRRRLFIIARRGRRSVVWPAPTHSRTGGRTLFGDLQRWRPAREVIDWSLPSRSIFGRKKPLSPNTMARIIAGLERFGGQEIQPFLVVLRNNMGARSLDEPLPTLSAGGQHVAICEPFILQQQSGGVPRSTDEPLPTIATGGAQALVQPFIVPPRGFSQHARVDSVDQPLRTIVAASGHTFALVEPFLVPHYGEREGQAPRTHSVDDPVPTIPATGAGKFELVEPFISSYYGTNNLSPVSAPLPTVTTKDRFALVLPVVDGKALDIRLRMLKPHELARAMSFSDDYQFAGTQGDQVKQIGNAWPCRLGQALLETLLEEYAIRRRGGRLEAIA